MKKKFLSGPNWEMLCVIVALAWPTMLEQMMQTAVQYIDTAMVGVLGTYATAAVGATGTVNWLVSDTLAAVGIGFLSYIARAQGAGENNQARRASAQAVTMVLFTGLLATALTLGLSRQIPIWMQVPQAIQDLTARYFFVLYLPMLPRTASIIFGTVLRAAGDTKTPMKIGLLVNFINIVLNMLFIYPTRTVELFGTDVTIYGAGWGVVGAAAASAIAFTIGGICITVVLYKHPTISPKNQPLRPDGAILRPCLKVTIPNMMQRFATSLGFVAFATMINALGEVAAAAHTIANTVESAFYIPGHGMEIAAATLAGNAYGARDNKRMKHLARIMLPLEIGLMIVSGTALFMLAPPLMGVFSSSAEVIALGTTVLRMVAVSEPFFGFYIIVQGVMLGVGKTRQPFLYGVAGMWLVRIVGTFICTRIFGLGLVSAWACMILHNMLMFALYLRCYINGSWNPMHGWPETECCSGTSQSV